MVGGLATGILGNWDGLEPIGHLVRAGLTDGLAGEAAASRKVHTTDLEEEI